MSSDYIESNRFGCALSGALALAYSIDRAAPIVHAGPGCGLVTSMGISWSSGFQFLGGASGYALPSTNTVEKHVIFGGGNRLREQIRTTLEILDADLFFIFTGCTADLIGDDTRQIASEFKGNGVPIVVAETGGFKGNTYEGYDIAYKALIEQLAQPVKQKKEKTVNLLGVVAGQDPFWYGNIKEIVRVLKRIGISINISGNGDNIENLKNTAEAELNVVLSGNAGLEVAKYLEENLGVPYLRYPLPIGLETSRFLRTLAERLNLDKQMVEEVIAEEEKEYWNQLTRFSDALVILMQKKEIGIIADANYSIGVTKFLANDLGQLPVLVVVTDDPDEKYKDRIEEDILDLKYELSPEIAFENDARKIAEKVENVKMQLLLGSSIDKPLAKKLRIPHFSISYPITDRVILNRCYAGYTGGINLLEDIGSKLASGLEVAPQV